MLEKALYNLLFALVSGFTEFLGVDASAHQKLFSLMSGQERSDPMLMLAVHVGVLLAVILATWPKLRLVMRERRYSGRKRRLKRQTDPTAQLDLQVLRTASVPMLLSLLAYRKADQLIHGFFPLALILLFNGLLLIYPSFVESGNKDCRSVSRLDATLIGLAGALGAFPGISRVGGMLTAASARGLSRTYALDTALLLSIPVLIGLIIWDLFAIMTGFALDGLLSLLVYILCAVVAFGMGSLSIRFQKYLSYKLGISGFAYYSWGLALFSLIFYLMI